MKTNILTMLIALPVIAALMANTPTPQWGIDDHTCVDFQIKNLKTNKGSFWLAFYKEPGKFPKKGGEMFSKLVPVKDQPVLNTEICGLQQGWYAVAAFQDLDDNGDMNTSMIGLPKEPYGFSNGVHPVFKAPSFHQCRFYIAPGTAPTVTIDMINP